MKRPLVSFNKSSRSFWSVLVFPGGSGAVMKQLRIEDRLHGRRRRLFAGSGERRRKRGGSRLSPMPAGKLMSLALERKIR